MLQVCRLRLSNNKSLSRKRPCCGTVSRPCHSRDRRSPGAWSFRGLSETFGRAQWHGRETVPQRGLILQQALSNNKSLSRKRQFYHYSISSHSTNLAGTQPISPPASSICTQASRL